MINLLAWLIAGGLIGGMASILLLDRKSLVTNTIICGMNGAMLGGFLFGKPTMDQPVVDLTTLSIALAGAVVLVGVLNLVRHGRVTSP